MEQTQVAEINAALPASGLTAADLGIDRVPGGCPLESVAFEGSPNFGYVYGLFRAAGSEAVRVPLHTAHLQQVSRLLHLSRHHWGI